MSSLFVTTRLRRRRSAAHCARAAERGAALVELAIVTPLILLLCYGAIEVGTLFRVSQSANVLGREAGSLAFRECTDFAEPTATATQLRTEACLNTLLFDATRGLQPLADAVYGAGTVRLIVSVYRADPVAGTLSRIAIAGEDAGTGRISKFNTVAGALHGPGDGLSAATVQIHRRLAVSEIYFNYDPLLNTFVGLLSTDYYEATVL